MNDLLSATLAATADTWLPIRRAYHWVRAAAYVLANPDNQARSDVPRAFVVASIRVRTHLPSFMRLAVNWLYGDMAESLTDCGLRWLRRCAPGALFWEQHYHTGLNGYPRYHSASPCLSSVFLPNCASK
jgi:hypothetical protein